ncbi:hypothetical protein CWI39_1399p0030 [Hamiltosporidium magnivora]|uniref:Uncharacterized protein n=1 Tax=Hamiltosporidium magnivora TaxID=148818 RepID=A0A4Q9L2P3_9MICR|nr:hypothetical protein CWI39_1399p0030 [Hamiltosporidium magnivora]
MKRFIEVIDSKNNSKYKNNLCNKFKSLSMRLSEFQDLLLPIIFILLVRSTHNRLLNIFKFMFLLHSGYKIYRKSCEKNGKKYIKDNNNLEKMFLIVCSTILCYHITKNMFTMFKMKEYLNIYTKALIYKDANRLNYSFIMKFILIFGFGLYSVLSPIIEFIQKPEYTFENIRLNFFNGKLFIHEKDKKVDENKLFLPILVNFVTNIMCKRDLGIFIINLYDSLNAIQPPKKGNKYHNYFCLTLFRSLSSFLVLQNTIKYLFTNEMSKICRIN